MEIFEEEIKSFTSAIVNKCKNAGEIKKNVTNYKGFLVNSKMINKNSEISRWLDIVINFSKLIISFKESDGYIDLDNFVESMKIYNARKVKVDIDQKHYGHYHTVTTDNCGTNYVESDSCGSSRRLVQNDTCGSNYQSTSQC